MPNTTVSDAVRGLGSSRDKGYIRSTRDKLKRIQLDEESANKIYETLSKKRWKNEEALAKATQKKIADFTRELNRKTAQQKKQDAELEYKTAITQTEKIAARAKYMAGSVQEAAQKAAKTTINAFNTGINQYLGVYSQYMSGIETRLQGAGKSYSDITGVISRSIGTSQYVSQAKVLENLSKLVEQGISYNVEQRAFLATISDKIATTFDVFDSNLARIIRIQQADSTIARLGLESQLTKFLNRTFGDTSYLSTMFDTVSASLLTASSTLGRDKSVEFEYTVQKWLGSLGAVGVSESTIQQLAQGIGYLGSGDVTSLSSNQALQNLLVMASGGDYASFLTGGVDATGANKLLRNIVTLAQDISNTNNRVLLAQYAQIFGMNVSDLMALSNLTSKDLVTISQNMLTYKQMEAETSSQLKTIGSRMSIKERIDTMFDNVMSEIGEGIASSAGLYTTWLITDLVEQATGGISIPTFGTMGTFLDLETTVTGLIKTGIVGFSTLANIGSILSGLTGANRLSLSSWGAEDVLTRGGGFTGLTTTGVTQTTSQTTYIGGGGESDIYAGSVAAASEEAKTKQTVTGADDSKDMQELMEEDIAGGIATIINILSNTGIVIRGSHADLYGYPTNMDGGLS